MLYIFFAFVICCVLSAEKVTALGDTQFGLTSPGNWSWVDPKTNDRCIIVQMSINISIAHQSKDNNFLNQTIVVPTSAVPINGSCSESTQFLKVASDVVNFTLTFKRLGHQYDLESLNFDVKLSPKEGPLNLTLVNGTLFKTFIDHSYYCQQPQFIYTGPLANITVSQVQLESFHRGSGFDFSTARNCAETFSTTVPIAVGIALFSFMALVLSVFFFVHRYRGGTRNYVNLEENEPPVLEERQIMDP